MTFIKDNKGFLSLLDGILAILILFMGLLIFNSVLNFYSPTPQDDHVDSKIANDVMELMILNIDENSYSTLEYVVIILKANDNNLNYETKNNIANILGNFLNKMIPDKNYLLVENNVLDGEVLVEKGDIQTASNISTTNRNLGEYSFTLSIF
ncbi:hypothetical protein KQY27_05995 [Methanobrevibacter sp. TMH8]|uniref:hypothetical protein n=1 Tax=Methanobrevibacter sp. TMH8 TaxID=2848611 RepID=UPI001CCA341C|nr:hypothetical protein [Methanobrevibacter sp. TMH8]MBZ9571088.1 hypothetical protein [Methanobrevibacter sp. TMH8]